MSPTKGAGAQTRRLRGADPLTVEVEVPGLVNRPLSQVAAATLADLLALASHEGLKGKAAVRLRGYAERVARELHDVPSGAPLASWMDGFESLDPAEVPVALREIVAQEAARREGPEVARIRALLDVWGEVEPIEFVFGQPRVHARQLTEGRRRKEPVKGGQARASAAEPAAPRRAAATRAPSPKPSSDPARASWVRQLVLERLRNASGGGLLEPVLVAAVRHRSRDRYPELGDADVKEVLRGMSAQGEIKLSARRWSARR